MGEFPDEDRAYPLHAASIVPVTPLDTTEGTSTMHTTSTSTSPRRIRTRRARFARFGIAALAAGAIVGVAVPAGAQRPRQGTTPATCDMEVDGKTVQVPEGSRVGLFYCGTDGEWHVGWLVDAIVGGTTTTTTSPVKTMTAISTKTLAVR